MKIIVGLGNPGEKYLKTRHNAGFMALDYILKDKHVISCSSKFDAKICEVHDPDKTFYVYPQTYMNDSGKAVKQIMDFYKVLPEDLIIIHDDVDLPIGTVRVTDSSSDAGHNGVKSIIESLGTQDFKRIRIGIEDRADKKIPPTDAFVLMEFTDDELHKIPFEEIKQQAA
ncbi:aminoacyl-tRNA hydrolase [Patescibacteria group bacterium]|nr:aminoacyl-tRNA hydrolase [Patescibacteria group bacterium]